MILYYGDFLSSLSLLASSLSGGFPYSVEHMAVEGHVWVNRLKPHTLIYVYTEGSRYVQRSYENLEKFQEV